MGYLSRLAGIGMLSFTLTACGGANPGVTPASPLDVPLRSAEATSVTQAFGPLIVRPGVFDARANKVPWSGSWLPLKSPNLFESSNGELAPLQKYDLYMERVHGQQTDAAETEQNDPNLYDPDALGWEGRCDAWAAASVMEPEPTKPITVAGITFSVGDLKDLLIKTYENTDVFRQFGRNFGPGPDADFNEIYPDQFHKAVQHEIFERHRLMVFDSDPTEQVWNTPMYRAMFDIKADPHNPNVMHVTAYIWGVIALGVSPIITDPNYVGTITVDYNYTYDLFGYPQGDGSFRVAYGKWTGDSRDDHPNFVSILTGKTDHSSNNSEISTKIVQEILSTPSNSGAQD